MPSHVLAVLSVYPELACRSGPFQVPVSREGIYKELLCVGKASTLQFAADVLTDVAALFPGRYIHVGGDEAVFDAWQESEHVRAFAGHAGLRNLGPDILEAWFCAVGKILKELGKQPIMWDDHFENRPWCTRLCPNAEEDWIVQAWKMQPPVGDGMAADPTFPFRSISSSMKVAYLDYPLASIDFNRTLEMLPSTGPRMLGGCATMWTEDTVPNAVGAKVYPRYLGIAERLWGGIVDARHPRALDEDLLTAAKAHCSPQGLLSTDLGFACGRFEPMESIRSPVFKNATISSSMEAFSPAFSEDRAIDTSDESYFWAVAPKAGDYMDVTFRAEDSQHHGLVKGNDASFSAKWSLSCVEVAITSWPNQRYEAAAAPGAFRQSSNLVEVPLRTKPPVNMSAALRQLEHRDAFLQSGEVCLEELIGTGSTAEVYRATWHGTDVAAKKLRSKGQLSTEFKREISVLLRLRHPNLVLFMGACTKAPQALIISEFCSGGTVFALLHQRRDLSLPWPQRLPIALDVAKGMNFLHRRQVVHRDLKSLNLLLACPIRGSDDVPAVKVSDFGLSRAFRPDAAQAVMTNGAGTYHWMAPEVLSGQGYDEKVDVYSYGICLFELITRRIPYEGSGLEPVSIAVAVSRGKRPDVAFIPEDTPADLRFTMKCCWAHRSSGRPGFDTILDGDSEARQVHEASTAFAELLDSSWSAFRQQLLEAYPDTTAGRQTPSEVLEVRFDVEERSTPAEEGAIGRKSMASLDSEEEDRNGGIEHGDSRLCLTSGMAGLSQAEIRAIRHRLRVRLGKISSMKLVSGKHDAVSGLGLTSYTVEDMNDLVNHLATFVGLDFEDLPEEKGWGGTIGMDSMSTGISMFGFGGASERQKDFSEPIWEWPTLKDRLHHSNTASSHTSAEKHERCNYNLVPRQVLIEVMMAQEGDPWIHDIHKRIFGAKLLQQFKAADVSRVEIGLTCPHTLAISDQTLHRKHGEAIKEILLAGDTNRLVAELTFVRINDLAAPPDEVSLLTYLEPFVGLVIVANGIMIGFQTSLEYENWSGWVYVEIVFACILLLELLLRLRLLKCRDFWCGAERLWNWFDAFLGAMAITDAALQLIWQASTEMDGANLLRFCRLLRLARIVKVFRLKFMRDLRLMIKGLVAGVWTLSLAFLLLAAVLYVIAGFTTVAIGRHARLRELGLQVYFTNIPMSMFTAFRCFTGECDHHVDMSRLTLTPSATLLTDDEIHENIQITKDLFLLVIQDRGVQGLMDELELPQERARLFEVIDADGSGTLHIAELVHGLLKIRGEANKSDLVAPLLATQSVQNMVAGLRDSTSTALEAMQAEVLRQLQELPQRIYLQSASHGTCSCPRVHTEAARSAILSQPRSLGAKGHLVLQFCQSQAYSELSGVRSFMQCGIQHQAFTIHCFCDLST
ncbi:STY46 [Symbiodinium sp. KB8]|nr:STY46 [Symbiodinium sp. KB8]